MQRSGKGARLSILLFLVVLACPPTAAHAIGPVQNHFGPDGLPVDAHATQPLTGYTYTIQRNDTLWDIAVAHDLRVDDLVTANSQDDLQMLHPGDTIFVPAQPPPPRKPPLPAAAAAPKAQTAGTPASPAAAPGSPAAQSLPAQLADWPNALLARINEQRTVRGIAALAWSPELAAAAQAHAGDCGRRDWGSHTGTDGAGLRVRLERAGYTARVAGENWVNAANVAGTFEMWWFEPPGADPHRRNILDPQYKDIGIGIAKGGWGYYFVADFGVR